MDSTHEKEILALIKATAPPLKDVPSASIASFHIKPDLNAWQRFIVRPKRPMRLLLARMFQQGINRNVTVVVGDRHFSCHLLPLQAISKFFREKDFNYIIQLPKENVTPRAFVCIYTWILTGTTSLNGIIMIELYRAAQFLGVDELSKLCWVCLSNQSDCEAQACFLLSETRSSSHFSKDILFARICKFFLAYVASKEYQELAGDDVCNLLARSSIGVNTEMEVLMAALVWLSFDWPKRKVNLKEVLGCVHFEQLPFLFLASIRKRRDCCVFEYIAASSAIDEVLQSIMLSNNTALFPKKLRRMWIYDPTCKYHHSYHCKTSTYLTYDQFLDYLEQLQTCDSHRWYDGLRENIRLDIKCCSDSSASSSENSL